MQYFLFFIGKRTVYYENSLRNIVWHAQVKVLIYIKSSQTSPFIFFIIIRQIIRFKYFESKLNYKTRQKVNF